MPLRTARDRLLIPLAAAITGMWLVAGTAAVYRNDGAVLKIVTVPFVLVAGYTFGEVAIRWTKRNGNGGQ